MAPCLLAACAGGQPTSQVPNLTVARAALDSGSAEIALNIATARLASRPNDLSALVVQGDAYTQLGNTPLAEADYTRALSVDPGSLDAKMGLGRLYLATNPAQAEMLLLEVVEGRQRDAVALNDLGIAQDMQGKHAAAQKSYARALGVAPNMQAPMTNLALSLALSGDAGKARRLLAPLARQQDAPARVKTDYELLSTMARNAS